MSDPVFIDGQWFSVVRRDPDGRLYYARVEGSDIPDMPDTDVFVADEALSAKRVVRVGASVGHVVYARLTELESMAPLGLTQGAVESGAAVTVIRAGIVSDDGWNWIPSLPIMLTGDGQLTQVQPTAAAFCLVMGFACGLQAMVLRINAPIFL